MSDASGEHHLPPLRRTPGPTPRARWPSCAAVELCEAGEHVSRPTPALHGDQPSPRRRRAAAVRVDQLTRVPLSRSMTSPPAATIAPEIRSAVAGV